ncbi:MAG: hypothetical protein RIB32_00110 [Phycisphaerales bacterium]
MSTTNLARTGRHALFAALFSPGVAAAGITGTFDLDTSYISGYVRDDNGFLGGSQNNLNGYVLSSTGTTFKNIDSSYIGVAATTSGGVDDPTGSSASVYADFDTGVSGAALQLMLDSSLEFRDNGYGDFQFSLIFTIDSDGTDPLPYELDTGGGTFNFYAIAGSGELYGDGTLRAGMYGIELFTSNEYDDMLTLRILPAPATCLAPLALILLGDRRRRRT